MFLLKRINPHGRSERMNPRSASVSSVPAMPVMKARLFMAPIRPRRPQGSRKRPLIPLDDALPAGSFQVAAELLGFVGAAERTDHGAVVDALFTQIGALDQRRPRSEHGRILGLQGPVGGL